MNRAFLPMLGSTVTVFTHVAANNYGEPTYSTTGVKYRARIVTAPTYNRLVGREDINVHSQIWIASTGNITVDDKIVLPDGTFRPILSIRRYPDLLGVHHHKVALGY